MKKDKTKSNTQSWKNTVRTTKYAVSMVAREEGGKRYIILRMFMALLDALFPLVFTIFPGLIINELLGQQRMTTIILFVSVLVITPIVQQLINTVFHIYFYKSMNRIRMNANRRIFFHSVNMDYENYEKPEYNVLRDRVHDAMWNLEQNINNIVGLFSSFISLVALFTIISILNIWLIVLICIIIFVNSIVTKRVNEKKYIYEKEANKWNNYNWAYRNTLVYNWNMKEVRLFNIKSLLIDSWSDYTKKENKEREKSHKIGFIPSSFSSFTNFIQQAAVYAFLVYNVINGQMYIGTMSIFLAATAQFSSSLGGLAHNYLQISESNLRINEVIEFFRLPLKQMETGHKTPVFDKNSVIEFRNVSFKYPGSEVYALKNLNITFHANEKLCIVGHNGAGKTTFIKLLTRLYFPTEGEIFLNGVNIYEYDFLKYQRLFAPVFQDGGCFNFTIGQNIVLGSEWNKEKVDEVCKNSGLKQLIDKQPKGYNTQIGKWLDEEGLEPSGGEEQRFKIARAVYHGGEIFLLDEPTAALDPLAEYEIYTQFNKMITDSAAILITHRLAAVQLADKVAVFENGTVVEFGTHAELCDAKGVYAEMYNKQSKFYKE